MKRKKDISGQRLGKLIALRDTGRATTSRNAIWECRCDCGGTTFVDTGKWSAGKRVSCGCSLKTQFICRAPGCDKKAHAHHLCHKHMRRLRESGTFAHSKTGTSNDIRERMAAKTRETATGCIEWTGAVQSSGYGSTTVGAIRKSTHRIAWELANGPIQNGLYVLHSCDNPRCVNVEHLFLGTAKDNYHDGVKKGRIDPNQIGVWRHRECAK